MPDQVFGKVGPGMERVFHDPTPQPYVTAEQVVTFYGYGDTLTEAIVDAQGNANRWLAKRNAADEPFVWKSTSAQTMRYFNRAYRTDEWAHIITITYRNRVEVSE